MYVIIAYDVAVGRVNKVKKFLRTQLVWVQNSLFEGELTDSRYMEIKQTVSKIINPEIDCLTIYKFQSNKAMERENLGISKGDPEDVVL